MRIFAKNYRGFRRLDVNLLRMIFLVGDNSSGKSSILYLIDAISKNDLENVPRLDEDLGVSEFDYFSPYFNNDDVTISFYEKNSDDEVEFAKIITLSHVRNSQPLMTSCTYFFDRKMVTFRKHRGGQKRLLTDVIETSIDGLVEKHLEESRFKKMDNSFEEMPVGDRSFLFTELDIRDEQERERFRRKSYSTTVSRCRLIPPLRALPEKFYNFRRRINSQGKHFATMWLDFSKGDDLKYFTDINQFGIDSSLFDEIHVKKIARNVVDSPLFVSFKRGGREFAVNQMGVGVSQIVPVLVETAFALSNGDVSVLIQQPELHLHPVAQAAFGTYLYKVAKGGLRGVIETHSSYLIDRFRAELRDDCNITENGERKLNFDDFQIIFCMNSEDGNHTTDILFDDHGRMINDPDSFHEFFISESVRTMF